MVTQTRSRDRRDSGRRGRQRRRPRRDEAQDGPELYEKSVKIRRVTKVVKGGRNLRFSALVVVGDYNGRVGAGLGKGLSVPDAVRKGRQNAERVMAQMVLKGGTIPHEITAKYGSAKVMLLPAAPGTGVIAGGGVRAVIEGAGIQDVLSKTYGGSNPVNTVRATIKALSLLRDPETERARRLGTIGIHRPEAEAEATESDAESTSEEATDGETANEAEAPAAGVETVDEPTPAATADAPAATPEPSTSTRASS